MRAAAKLRIFAFLGVGVECLDGALKSAPIYTDLHGEFADGMSDGAEALGPRDRGYGELDI